MFYSYVKSLRYTDNSNISSSTMDIHIQQTRVIFYSNSRLKIMFYFDYNTNYKNTSVLQI